MSKGILLARNTATLAPCAICRKPTPPEHLAGGKLCHTCWGNAANERGWVSEPLMQVQVPEGKCIFPVRVVLPAMLEAHMGQRGEDQTPARTLARLLWEREALQRERVDQDGWQEAMCCYCGEAVTDSSDARRTVPALELTRDGLPPIFYCQDFHACDQRLAVQIALLVQRLSQGKRPE